MKSLKELQKKGNIKVSGNITYLIGALIIVVLAVALAPTMFSGLADLSSNPDVPSWVGPVMVVIVGAGLVFLIWKAFGGH